MLEDEPEDEGVLEDEGVDDAAAAGFADDESDVAAGVDAGVAAGSEVAFVSRLSLR